MRKHKFPILLGSALFGLFASTLSVPAIKIYIDTMGYPKDFLQYENDVAYFIRGVVVCIFTLISARVMKASTTMVLLATVLALLLFQVYVAVALESTLITVAIFTKFRWAFPGYFVGVYFVIGIWLSILQYDERK
ncbi:MAG: hypothetical protein GXP15_09815 [Gammaproteobacteria bacterium]|nr:hypothetical protein [Gammaproteobacteria bacterium]